MNTASHFPTFFGQDLLKLGTQNRHKTVPWIKNIYISPWTALIRN